MAYAYRWALPTNPFQPASPILLDASSVCIPRIPTPNTQRKKESYIYNILSDFMAQRSSLVSMSDEGFKSWASESAKTAGKIKKQVFAYRSMQNLYGDIIGSACQELSHEKKYQKWILSRRDGQQKCSSWKTSHQRWAPEVPWEDVVILGRSMSGHAPGRRGTRVKGIGCDE